MILILGPSGAVGTPAIKSLVARGAPLRALSSSDASAERLTSLGVQEVVRGDWHSASDLAAAIKGVEQVLYVPARFKEDEFEVGRGIVDAAIAEGVDHFLFCSAYHPQIEALGHHWQKLRLEEYLIDSDLHYTVVQPSMFMQNIRVEWPAVSGDGIYSRPYSPDSLMNVIDTADLGDAIAEILTQDRFRGATYELCGAELVSHTRMAEIISEELGKQVTAVHRDLEEWKSWAQERGWADYAIEAYSHMCEHYDAHGYKYGNDVTLLAIVGRPATDYRTFIRRFIAEQAL